MYKTHFSKFGDIIVLKRTNGSYLIQDEQKGRTIMNEKLKYAEMLEIPQSTCNITYKPAKRKRTKQPKNDIVKDALIEKVNSESEQVQDYVPQNEIEAVENVEQESCATNIVKTQKQKKHFKITAVGVELCVIGALIMTILISSAVLPNSGITSFFSNAFTVPKSEVVDSRVFSDFEPCFNAVLEADVTSENGVMSIKNQKSLYAPCDGKVQSVEQSSDGLFDITISHSDNFKTIIKGAKYCYVENGASVFKTIPIAYAGEQDISICFVDGQNNIITDNVVKTCSSLWG